MNNCLGSPCVTEGEMHDALEDYLVSSEREGLRERRHMHYRTGGYYSSEIIAHVLNTACMSRHSRILGPVLVASRDP